jgi:biopolymer transport protein ExbB/TolQ
VEAAAKEEADLSQQRVSTAVSFGSTLMGALFGRKALSVSNVQRAGSTWKSASRAREEERQLERAREKLADLQEEARSLEAQFQAEVQALQERVDPVREPLEAVELRPRRTDVAVRLVGIGWAPVGPTGQPAWRG